jgi:hypothetical protein
MSPILYFLRDVWIRTQVEKLATVSGLRIYSLFVQFLFYWTRLLEGQINADPCGSGSETLRKQMAKIVATQLLTVATQLLTVATQLLTVATQLLTVATQLLTVATQLLTVATQLLLKQRNF